MKIKDQVTSKLSKKLKELGVKKNSKFYFDNLHNLYVKLDLKEGFMFRISDETYHDGTTVGSFYLLT